MTSESVTDETLMLRYRGGDPAAFDLLYARHRGGLYRFLLRRCGDRALTDELFQDVWLGLIGARDRYRADAPFGAWLYRMAHNRLIDRHRRDAAAGPPPSSLDETFDEGHDADATMRLDGIIEGHGDPARQIEWRQALQRLADGIEALPLPQREAFLLRQEGGLDIAAIAEVTGVGLETARSRLRHATERLRRFVGWPAPACPGPMDDARPDVTRPSRHADLPAALDSDEAPQS